MPIEEYIVKVNRPDNCPITTMIDHIYNAVSSMSGSYEPPNDDNGYTGHPLFPEVPCKVRRFTAKDILKQKFID